MTNKQRFMSAVRGEAPDVVPVSPLIHNRYAHAVLGRTGWEAMFEVHQMVGSIHHRDNGRGGVHVHMPEGYRDETSEIERGPDGRTTTQTLWHAPYGTLRSREVSGATPHDPMVSKTVEYFVKGEDDWEIYRRMVEDRLAGLGDAHWEDYLRAAEVFGEEAVAVVGLPTAFVRLMMLRGMQGILTDLYDCPELLQSILDLERQVIRRTIEAFLAFGTVEDARKETMRCLREGMEGGGYVLVTGDEVPADTKMDNLKAMVETVEEQGKYDR